MAKRTLVEIIDDLDGSRIESHAGGTFPFALEGVNYEIDLTNVHADELRQAMAPFIAKARRVGGGRRTSRTATSGNAAEIRAWAKANGHDVPERGRIPASIAEAYRAAN